MKIYGIIIQNSKGENMVLKTSHLMQPSIAYIFSKKLYYNFYEKK